MRILTHAQCAEGLHVHTVLNLPNTSIGCGLMDKDSQTRSNPGGWVIYNNVIMYVTGTFFTLGAHVQRGVQFVCLSVCLSVCLCVDAYSGTTGYEAAH